MYNLDWQ